MLSQLNAACYVVNDGQEQAGLADKLNQRHAVRVVFVPIPVDIVLCPLLAQRVTSGAKCVVIALLLEKFGSDRDVDAVIFNVERRTGCFTAEIRYFGTGPRQSDHLTSCRGLFC